MSSNHSYIYYTNTRQSKLYIPWLSVMVFTGMSPRTFLSLFFFCCSLLCCSFSLITSFWAEYGVRMAIWLLGTLYPQTSFCAISTCMWHQQKIQLWMITNQNAINIDASYCGLLTIFLASVGLNLDCESTFALCLDPMCPLSSSPSTWQNTIGQSSPRGQKPPRCNPLRLLTTDASVLSFPL